MTALSSDLETNRQEGVILEYPVAASQTIYKGAMVMDNGTGYAVPAAFDASGNFLGVAVEQKDNSSGSDGDKKVRVYKTGVFEYTKPTAAQGDVGVVMYVRDDQTVDTSVTNSVTAGYCVTKEGSSAIRIKIDRATQ